MTEQELRERAVSALSAWMGAKKGSSAHREIIDIYNGYTPRPRGYKMTYADNWCAAAVSAAAIRAGLTAIMPVECSCAELIKLHRSLGQWVEDDSYLPKPGDLIMYDWGDDGKGDCTGAPEHVGMVEKVAGSRFTVIEGNKGSESVVGRRTLYINGRFIRGYCCPNYKKAAQNTREEEQDMKLYQYVNELPYGKEAVARAIRSGYIKLDKNGAMGLWEPNIQTVILMDRAGAFDKPAIEGR